MLKAQHPLALASVFAAVLLAGCNSGDKKIGLAYEKQIEPQYEKSPRAMALLGNLGSAVDDGAGWKCDCPEITANGNGADYNIMNERYEFLAEDKVQFQLSGALPAGAAVQVFKDKILLDQMLPEHVQTIALKHAMAYMQAQKKDNLPYGQGEAFTIGSGELVPVSKNHREYEKVLLPVAGPPPPAAR